MGCIFFKTGIDYFSDLETPEFRDIVVIDINGYVKKIGDHLKHKKLLIITNTATHSWYTKNNYSQINDLQKKYNDQGLECFLFPCNQFFSSETFEEKEINKYISHNFEIKYPLFSKIDVNGENTHELYRYLKKHSKYFNLGENRLRNIPWSFTKFIVTAKGEVLRFYSPDIEPKTIENDIIDYLKELS